MVATDNEMKKKWLLIMRRKIKWILCVRACMCVSAALHICLHMQYVSVCAYVCLRLSECVYVWGV